MPHMPTLAGAVKAPLLRYQIADHGRDKVELSMNLALSQTVDVMNVSQPPNPDWRKTFVSDFLAKYDSESMDDFAMFLQMFRRGELGTEGKPQLYAGRLDGSILFDCWGRYMEKKVDMREGMYAQRKGSALKEITEAVNESPAMKKLAEQLKNTYREEEQARRREQSLKTEKHKAEGLLMVDKAMSVEELRRIWIAYPYQGVHNVAKLRAEELKAMEDDVKSEAAN